MPDSADTLTPAEPNDSAAYALRRQGRRRVSNADEIVAERFV
jgi:hypothetical protein